MKDSYFIRKTERAIHADNVLSSSVYRYEVQSPFNADIVDLRNGIMMRDIFKACRSDKERINQVRWVICIMNTMKRIIARNKKC